MKIESRGIDITEVPRVRHIVVKSDTVSIQFENSGAAWIWTFSELREFHAAIAEALKHAPDADERPVAEPKKTEWREGDPEPEGVTEVIDCDGALWKRVNGWWKVRNGGYGNWVSLLKGWGPVRLLEDEK